MKKTFLICVVLLPVLILAERSLADIANDEAKLFEQSTERSQKMINELAAMAQETGTTKEWELYRKQIKDHQQLMSELKATSGKHRTDTIDTVKLLTELQRNTSAILANLKNSMAEDIINRYRLLEDLSANESKPNKCDDIRNDKSFVFFFFLAVIANTVFAVSVLSKLELLEKKLKIQ